MATTPECKHVLTWLRANKISTAALTGQDARALAAIAHCWELYSVGDDVGQRAALAGARALLGAMQSHTRELARQAIPAVMDWSDRERVWQRMMAMPLPMVTFERAQRRGPVPHAGGATDCGCDAPGSCDCPCHDLAGVPAVSR